MIAINYSAAYFQTYQRLREVTLTKIRIFLTSIWSEEGVSNVTPLSDFLILIQFKANLTLNNINLSSSYAYVNNLSGTIKSW